MANTYTHSPADIVRYLFIQKGWGTLPTANGNWPIYVSNEPDQPDNCITIFNTTGIDQGRSMIDGDLWGMNGIQVRVRAIDENTNWLKADSIQIGMAKSVYNEIVSISTSSYRVGCFSKISDVINLVTDKPLSIRKLATINAVINIEQLV